MVGVVIPDDYVPVLERIVAMRADHPDWQLTTSLLIDTDDRVLIRAQVLDAAGHMIASAYAEEPRTGRRFVVETCETSAVGRVLRFAGYPDKRGLTDEEVRRSGDGIYPPPIPDRTGPTERPHPPADTTAGGPVPILQQPSPGQLKVLFNRLAKDGVTDPAEALAWINAELDDPDPPITHSSQLSEPQVTHLIAGLIKRRAHA